MIPEIKKLKRVGDILNCEGSILGLHSHNGNYYLSSFLNDGSGEVYYSTTKEKLNNYLNDAFTLTDLYAGSGDIMVTRQFRKDSVSFLKEDFLGKIQCGNSLYSKISEGMKNSKVEKLIREI